MLLRISNVLSGNQLPQVQAVADHGAFVSGLATASGAAAKVKRNLQLDADSAEARAAGEIVLDALRSNFLFDAATMPVRMSPVRFSRYEVGMGYGDHLDAALMTSTGKPLRTDIAVTVWLSDPSTYDGGELVIDNDYGIETVKLGLGDVVVYPATTFHHINPVTRGVRSVAVLWVQSAVRDAARRKILFDLAGSINYLDDTTAAQPAVDQLRRCHLNLLRMWADV